MSYLMDDICQTVAVIPPKQFSSPVLSIFPDLARRMEHAPRFLLDDPTIACAVDLTLGRPRILREAMRYLIIPYRSLWVEWSESGRARIREQYARMGVGELEPPGRPIPNRIGFLMECDEGGRRGVITWCWSSPEPMREFVPPNVAPISAYFDLDANHFQEQARIEGLLRGNLAKMWSDNPSQLAELFSIWRTANHEPSRWGKGYLMYLCSSEEELIARLMHSYADVYGEFIQVWAIMMLLTASRQAVDYQPVSRAKVNKNRLRRRQAPLLDHTTVILHLNQPKASSGALSEPSGRSRKSPRIHAVSSYLARRGNRHWVVAPYLRGSGGVVHRHVNVRG